MHFFASVPDLNVKLVTDGIALTDVLFVLGILLVQSVNVELKDRMFILNSFRFAGFFIPFRTDGIGDESILLPRGIVQQ